MFAVMFYSELAGEVAIYLGEVTARYGKTIVAGGRRYSSKYVEIFDTEPEALDFLAEL